MKTGDYEMFKFVPGNRPISRAQIDRLKNCMTRKNLLADCKILVAPDYYIIDGQHRFVAAKELGLEIEYEISKETTIDDIAMINSNQMKWRLKDYIHHYSQAGKSEYKLLEEFMARHGISIDPAIIALSIRDSRGGGEIKRGTLRISDKLETANRLVDHCKDFAEYVPFWCGRSFVGAVKRLMLNNPGYQPGIMRSKMEYQSTRLVGCIDAAHYYDLLCNIYNYKSSKTVTFIPWKQCKE